MGLFGGQNPKEEKLIILMPGEKTARAVICWTNAAGKRGRIRRKKNSKGSPSTAFLPEEGGARV